MNIQDKITAKNYSERAVAFMQANGGEGFIVVQRTCSCKGDTEKRHATPEQWKAWRQYLAKIGYKLTFFDRQDYFTVPAEWPHQFDAAA